MSNFSCGFKDMMKQLVGLALLLSLGATLGGCSGAVSSSSLPDTGPATLVVTLTEVNSAAARTGIAFGSPAKVSVTFKTSRGNPIVGAVITFTTDSTLGVFNPTTGTALTDATGVASVILNSSTASGAGTVTASGQTTLSGATSPTTYTNSISYTAAAVAPPASPTGVPSQGGFSLSVSTFNIEGGNIDGVTTQVTARLADRFSNPVPDGTAVNFMAAGGSIVSSCTTVAGACSSTMTSQNFRPTNGRVAILAYAIGEESFTDRNGNGWFDIAPVSELMDLNGRSTDLPEAWLDVNENGVRDANEPFIDFNNNGRYDDPDGKFNGVSCDDLVPGRSVPGSCGTPKSVHVRGNTVVVFSGSVATITTIPTAIALAPCSTTVPFVRTSATALFTVRDANGNVMPAGTTVAFAATNGRIISSPETFTVPSSNASISPSPGADGVRTFAVTVESDAAQSLSGPPFSCENTRPVGTLTATVKAPSGTLSTFSIPVTD